MTQLRTWGDILTTEEGYKFEYEIEELKED